MHSSITHRFCLKILVSEPEERRRTRFLFQTALRAPARTVRSEQDIPFVERVCASLEKHGGLTHRQAGLSRLVLFVENRWINKKMEVDKKVKTKQNKKCFNVRSEHETLIDFPHSIDDHDFFQHPNFDRTRSTKNIVRMFFGFTACQVHKAGLAYIQVISLCALSFFNFVMSQIYAYKSTSRFCGFQVWKKKN